MRAAFVLCAFCSLFISRSPAQDSPEERHGPEFGTFSNLKLDDYTGDLLGLEITVIPGYRTAYVIFQCAEGAPGTPVFVPAEVSPNQIHFIVPVTGSNGQDCGGEFSASVTARGIRIQAGKSLAHFLPRRRSYWAR